jgi:ferrochelatase
MQTSYPCHGVLLINLGSPETCTVSSIRQFLGEFLTDPDVITLKSPFRQILFKGIVAPIRSRKVLEKYQSIWHESGISPLHYFTQRIEQSLQDHLGNHFLVMHAMRYQKPSMQAACEKLSKLSLKSLTIIPLFAQEAKETTGSIYRALDALLMKYPTIPKPSFIRHYFQEPMFIDAMATLYKPLLTAFHPDIVLWSYHGLPNQSIKPFCTQACIEGAFQKPCHAIGSSIMANQSCYRAQCYATSRAIEKALAMPTLNYQTVFQSRFGPLKWIGPGLLASMQTLAKQGHKKIAIACPSFMTDCLETLEEVNIAAREYWLEQGGEDFLFLPCVNNQPNFINGLAKSVLELS